MLASYQIMGDGLHGLNLLNIALYGSLLYMYGFSNNNNSGNDTDNNANANKAGGGIFDQEWLKEGFCTPHEDVPYWTTHDRSGYAMIAIAMLGMATLQFLSQTTLRLPKGASHHGCDANSSNRSSSKSMTQAKDLAFWAMVGALGHAAGHFLISHAKRRDFYPPSEMTFLDDLLHNSNSLLEAMGKACPGYPLFWMPLVRTYMMNTAKGRVALVALFFWLGSLFMQTRFGFSYAQSVLFAGLSLDQLMLPTHEKQSFEYATWPLITTIPNGIFAWVESTACSSSWWMQEHGHLIYDIYMVTSYIVFYVISWARVQYFSTYVEKTKSS